MELADRLAFEAWICHCATASVTEVKPNWCVLSAGCGVYVLIPLRP